MHRFKIHIYNILCIVTYVVYWVYIYAKVPLIRHKKHIRVLFMLQELAAWKTELLYNAMQSHPRFIPIIAVTNSSLSVNDKSILVKYLRRHNYQYIDLDPNPFLIRLIKADFVFYYKPYVGQWDKNVCFFRNKSMIPLSIDYCMSVSEQSNRLHNVLFRFSYLFFTENMYSYKTHKMLLGLESHNVIMSGTPVQDLMLNTKESFSNPWLDNKGRKRIIYAPHHSIPETNYGTYGRGIEYATILEFGEFLLEIAKKYQNQITVAFKPHPALYLKLCQKWGREKTDLYYSSWNNGENTQIETGDYVGLFKYSDAMIHDSSSFIAEYQYVDKPCLFLVRGGGEYVPESLNEFGKAAFNCHEVANCKEQIESFVKSVIRGEDRKHERRKTVMNDYLIPPYGRTACENIINAILGLRQLVE